MYCYDNLLCNSFLFKKATILNKKTTISTPFTTKKQQFIINITFINILLSIIFPMFEIDHLLQIVPMVVCRNFCFEVQNSYKIIGFVLQLQITIGSLFS